MPWDAAVVGVSANAPGASGLGPWGFTACCGRTSWLLPWHQTRSGPRLSPHFAPTSVASSVMGGT